MISLAHLYFYQDKPSDWYHSLTCISTKISHQIDITHSLIFLPRWAIRLISLAHLYFYQDKPSAWYHSLTYISTKISHQIDITHSLIFLPRWAIRLISLTHLYFYQDRVREYLKFSVRHRTDRMQISASLTKKLVVLQFVKLLITKDD